MRVDLTTRQGADFQIALTLTDPTTGDPIDATGYSGALNIKDFAGNSLASVAMVLGSATNILVYAVPSATTGSWVEGFAEYDVTYTDTSGIETAAQHGTLAIEAHV